MNTTENTITEFTRLLFAKVASRHGGECTLNELRVMNACHAYSFEPGHCSPTQIAVDTGIPKSTVSRSIASLVQKGWIEESVDPRDRRRRVIRLSPQALEARDSDWTDAIGWINQFSVSAKP